MNIAIKGAYKIHIQKKTERSGDRNVIGRGHLHMRNGWMTEKSRMYVKGTNDLENVHTGGSIGITRCVHTGSLLARGRRGLVINVPSRRSL